MKKLERELNREPRSPFQGVRPITVFEKGRIGANSQSEKVGVPKSRRVHTLPLFVTGTGRCGTTWMSKTLCAAGFDIPHECCGNDGTVSFYLQKDHDWYPYHPWTTGRERERVVHLGERASDFAFNFTVHLVRHPLKVVRSMRSIIPQLTFEFFKEVGLLTVEPNTRPADLRNMDAVLQMYRNCDHLADMTTTIEGVKKNWKRMLQGSGLEHRPMPELPPTNKSSGFKKSEPMTWDEAFEIDAGIAKDLKKYAKKFKLE